MAASEARKERLLKEEQQSCRELEEEEWNISNMKTDREKSLQHRSVKMCGVS